MMDLTERVAEVDALMQTMKRDWVEGNPDSTDLVIFIHVYRADQLIATLQCPLDRDTALQAGRLAAFGMAAEVLVTTFEAWHSKFAKCPVTGRPWEPGEMAYLGSTSPEALKKGWVEECLTTAGYDRDGRVAMVSRPYRITDHQVEFGDPMSIDSTQKDHSAGGYMDEQWARIMAEPTVLDRMSEDTGPGARLMEQIGEAMDQEVREFHMDVAALKAMADRELIVSAVLAAQEGSTRLEKIRERFDAAR